MKKKPKIIFDIRDVLNNHTVLWEDVLKYHILLRHPTSGIFIEKIKEAITNPDFVIQDRYGAYLFYKKLDEKYKEVIGTTDNYLLVCSKSKRTFRFISTSYTISRPKPGGKIIWQKQKSL